MGKFINPVKNTGELKTPKKKKLKIKTRRFPPHVLERVL